jgi:hypothetical protein
MTNNQKTLIYIAIGAVSIFVVYKLVKGKNPLDNTIRTPDGQPVPLIPKDISDDSMAKVKTLLEAKRAKYENLWKQSGSKLSFKDWYIENAE